MRGVSCVVGSIVFLMGGIVPWIFQSRAEGCCGELSLRLCAACSRFLDNRSSPAYDLGKVPSPTVALSAIMSSLLSSLRSPNRRSPGLNMDSPRFSPPPPMFLGCELRPARFTLKRGMIAPSFPPSYLRCALLVQDRYERTPVCSTASFTA